MKSPGAERAVRRYLLRYLRHDLDDYSSKEERGLSTAWLLRRKRQVDRPRPPALEQMMTAGGRMRFVLSRAVSLLSLIDDQHRRMAAQVSSLDPDALLMGRTERFSFIQSPPTKDRRRVKREQRRLLRIDPPARG